MTLKLSYYSPDMLFITEYPAGTVGELALAFNLTNLYQSISKICLTKMMEDQIMTLAKLSNNWFPSTPSVFDRIFDGELMDWNRSNFSDTNSTLPAVNVKENSNEFLIEVAAPGMNKEDFKINYDNGRLTISSEHENKVEEKDGERVTRREFSYQSFQRSFAVAENAVEADKIGASYKNGILHIKLPKREELKPKPAKEIKIS